MVYILVVLITDCVYEFVLSLFHLLSEEPENVEKFQKRLVKVTTQHNDECKRLLQLMGIPFIEVFTVNVIVSGVHDLLTEQNDES